MLWPGGRTRVLGLGGIGSRSGDATVRFAPLLRYMARRGGYDPRRDLLELSYAGEEVDGHWQPRPYTASDTKRSLLECAEAVAGCLEWYRNRLPEETRFCLVGYSLGGVATLDGVTMVLARDRVGWQGRLAVVTIAAPVRGCNLGPLLKWAWLVTPDMDHLGAAGDDLERRWNDPQEQERVLRRAQFMRAAGASLLTLTDPDDAVVRPDEALLPAPDEDPQKLLVRTVRVSAGTHGHGGILESEGVWWRVLGLTGPQERLADESLRVPDGPTDPALDDEVAAIRARLRAEGRLPT